MPDSWYRSISHTPGHLRLRDKTCVMFGAGAGVAATTARVFAAEGCKILAVDENERAIHELVALIQEEGGFAVSCCASTKNADNFVRSLSTRDFQRLDILIENGADSDRDHCWLSSAYKGAEEFTFCRESFHLLIARFPKAASSGPLRGALPPEGSSIVAILSRMLENAPGAVRVNAVCFKHELPLRFQEQFTVEASGLPAGDQRAEDPATLALQIAYAALFLASDEARFVHGVSIPIGDDSFQTS
jgi:NAD(P)-dependent dehydrogenase (short-subunit alcohol dehydrogenase family)